MSVKDKLQIILITYNRAKHVQKTLEQTFYDGSPILDYDFMVLDNNSTDNTQEVVRDWQKKFPNIKYSKNKYNIGLSGNIAKAMEIAEKEYLWTISDDDKLDFSNWGEVEKAIANGEELIFVARYSLPDEHKNDPDWWLLQATFIPGYIIKTSLFNDDTIKNAFDNIYTLFPHLCPILKFVNDGKKAYVLSKYVVDAGALHGLCADDLSYTRGSDLNNTYIRTKCMSWIVGYANIVSILKDTDLKNRAINSAISSIHKGRDNFIRDVIYWYGTRELSFMLLDTYIQLDSDLQKKIDKLLNWNLLIKKSCFYGKSRYLFYRMLANFTFGNLRKYCLLQKKIAKMRLER